MQQKADTTTTITDEKKIAIDNVSDGLDSSEKVDSKEFTMVHILIIYNTSCTYMYMHAAKC